MPFCCRVRAGQVVDNPLASHPYSSQWQTAMDAKMASWKSTRTYVDAVPPPGANIVDGMWIFRVKRPSGSPPVFKARYVARSFSQRQGVDFFQTFSPTPKMTTLQVLLHVTAQRDYELHSLDLSTAFLQGSLHEEIWLRRPPGFTGSFPAGTQTTLAALGFAPTADPSLFLHTDTSLPPFYVLVYVDNLVFATADTEALALVKSELQKRHTCIDLGELRSYLGLQITRDRARCTITLTQSHMVQQVLQRFGFRYSSPQSTSLPTGHSLSAPPLDESVEPSGTYPELVGCLMYRTEHWQAAKRFLRYSCSTSGMGLVLGGRGPVVLTGHADTSWVDDLATQGSSQGYTFSLGSGSVSWWCTRSSFVLSSNCEAEIYAGAMAAQELRWFTYLLTDLGERPRSSLVIQGSGDVAEKRNEPPPSKIEALDGSNYEERSGPMRSAFKRYKLLKLAMGEEKMPEEGDARDRWIEKSAVLYDLILQSVNNDMFQHIKDLVELDDSRPKLWKLLRDGIQPITLPVVIVLEKELAAWWCFMCLRRREEIWKPLGDGVTVSDEEISGVTEDGGEPEVEQQQQQQDAPPRAERPPDSPRRDVRPPNWLTYPNFGKPKVVRAGSVSEHCDEDEIAHCYLAAVPEPKTLAEALSEPDAEKRKQNMKEEYDCLLEKKAISSKLIFRHKYGPDGELTHYKSRLVAKGFQQTKGKDFDDIFAPVGKGRTLRVSLAAAANRGWRIKQMDIITAFLNGIILEELYMQQPEGLDDGSGRVCRLKKAIYGLKQAPHAWYHKLEETLLTGAFVRDLSADKLSPRAVPCVFLGFPPDAPGWQFYHPTSRRVLSSQDVTFDESVPYYRLFPYRTASLPPPPLFLLPGPSPVDPLPPQGPAPSGVSQVDAAEPVEVAVDSGAATGTEPAGAGSEGAEPGGAETWGAEPGGAEPSGAEPGGAETGGAEPWGAATGGTEPWGAEPRGAEPGGAGSARVASGGTSSRREVLSPRELREWFARRWSRAAGAGGTPATTGCGGAGPGGARATGPGGATETAGVGPAGGSAGVSGGTGAVGSAGPAAAGAPRVGAAGGVGASVSANASASEGAGAGAAGAGGATGAGVPAGSSGAVPAGSGGASRLRPYFVPLLEQVLGLPPSPGPAPPLDSPQPVQSQSLFQPVSPLPAPSPYTGPTGGLAERRAPASRPASPARPAYTSRRTSCPRPPAVPGTHQMTLRPSTARLRVPLPSPPLSSLPALPDPESDSLRAASPTVARFLATVVTDPSPGVLLRLLITLLSTFVPLVRCVPLCVRELRVVLEPSGPYPELVGCLMYLMTCTRPDLAYPLSILARYVAPGRHRPEHMAAAKRVLRYLCSTSGMGLVLGGRRPVVLTGHADASWADDQATQRSSQGYTFSLGSGSVSWRSTRSSSVLSSSCEAEIYAGAMAAQELRWLTYLLTDLGEQPRSPPVLYVDNKAMLALCREHRLEHRTKHIALRYFLARELQQRGQLRLAYVASEANTADIFTKALVPGDHQRFCTLLGFPTCTQHSTSSFIPDSSQYDLILQSVNNDMFQHIKDLVELDDSGPKAWKLLRNVIQPNTLPMVIVLEKELAALSMRPGDDVKLVLDKIMDTYARLAAAGSNVSQMQQCTKIISVLDNSWDNLIPTLNTQQDQWTPEWLRQQILQEDFRMRHTGGGAANKTTEGYGAAGGSRGRGGGRGRGHGRGSGRGRGRATAAAVATAKATAGGEEIAPTDGALDVVKKVQQPQQPHGVDASAAWAKASSGSGEADWETWHERLCHVNFPMLQKLVMDGSLKGLEVKGVGKEFGSCPTCLETKFTKFPFSSGTGPAKAPLALVHMDVVGHARASSLSGSRYFLTIVDDHTRAMWVYPLHTKGEVAAAVLKEWMPRAQRESGHKVNVIRTDNREEFIGADFEAMLKKKGIQHQLTVPYNPQQNSVAERFNRTLVLATVGDKQWVPYTKWYGSAPAVNMLRAYGCMVVFHGGGEPEVEEQQQQQQEKQQDAPPRAQRPLDRPRRDVRPPNRLTYHSFGKPKVIRARSVAEQCDEDEIAHCYWAAVPEPKMLAEALSGPDAEKWKQSVKEEYDSLLENETWELCELPPGKKTISSKLIFRHNCGPDGELTRYKLRLVAKGFQQTKGKDFDKIFAPVGKGTTLRALRAWYHKLEETLLAGGFKKSKCDHSLFLLQEKEQFLMLLVYVDDILLLSESSAMIEHVEEMQFKYSKMGDVKYYLGMHVERDLDKGVLRLHQRKYCEGLAEKYGLQDGGKPATPLPSGFNVEPCADEEVVGESDRKLFHSMVGAVNYAANHTRPDIAFTTSSLASVVSHPSHEQLEAAKRLVRYVSATASVGLEYSAVRQRLQRGATDLSQGEMLLTCYTDASFNSVKADGTSIGGYVCLI
ncbi:unnamed protein product [Closterium sp. NIES-54]